MDRTDRSAPSIRLIIMAALAAGTLACAGTAARAQTGPSMIALDKMTVGSAPTDFEFARTGQGGPGQWVVVNDPSGGSGRAIEQTSTDRTDYRFPLAIYRPVAAQNVEVSLRFKPLSGRVDQAGGIAVRLADADNYYVVRANALEGNVRFYHVLKGRRTQLQTANLKVAANVWHTLALKAEGDKFTITFDGKPLYTVSDKTFTQAGRVALWTKADSVTRFDQIGIQVLP